MTAILFQLHLFVRNNVSLLMDVPVQERLSKLRAYYNSGAAGTYTFRKTQLQLLKDAIYRYESRIHQALFSDLKKSPEESWVTETGFVIAEINHCLKHLKRWMKPEKVSTNLLNFPSRSYIYKEPLGVVLVIGPWNYPFQLLLAPVVGAIAAGNCVVVKPSELAPATSAILQQLVSEVFSDDHVICVEGDGAAVVPEMMDTFRFDHIFYTGSTAVGRSIYSAAAKDLIPVTLELGGKSPCVVEADANIKVAAKRIALTKFSNAGQMCVAPDYVLVHQSVREVFIQELKKAIIAFYGAEPAFNYDFGKLVSAKQWNRLQEYIRSGNVIFGGRLDAATLHIEPTLLDDVSLDAPIMQEEIFGPVLPILSFNSFEEAKAVISRNPDPLAFYIFTQGSATEEKWLEAIHFGGGCVNNASWHLTNLHLPFGGRGNSGIGAYHGKFSFDTFTHRKAVMKTPTWFDPKIKYPPFRGKLSLFKKLIR